MLEQPGDELQRFLEEIRCPFEARPALNTLCRERVLPSRVARGDKREERMSRRR